MTETLPWPKFEIYSFLVYIFSNSTDTAESEADCNPNRLATEFVKQVLCYIYSSSDCVDHNSFLPDYNH